MQASQPGFRLGDEDVGGSHVLALIDGEEEGERLLRAFVLDGLASGQREIHVVEGTRRAHHLDWLTTIGVDVKPATADGRLDVRTSDEAFVTDGRFERSPALAWVRRALTETRAGSVPSTRMLIDMHWATDDVIEIGALIAFERALDRMAQSQPAVVVCVYDINDLDAARVADVLVVHPNAIVRGKPRPTGHAELPAVARERILATAARLFHDAGIRATGVDRLIEQAGVAKATFYRHFPSKDDLVEAWLRDPRTRWFDRIRAQAQSSGPAPREEMLLFFEAVAEWLETDGFRGCPYLNTTVEITDPANPARVIARETTEEIGAYVRSTVTAAGYADAERLANELHTLLAGAISLAVALETGAPAAAALEAARQLLPESGRQPDAGLAARV